MAKKRTESRNHKFFLRRPVKIILGIIILLVIIRLILPYVVLHYANKTLSEMHGYRGHVRDIDIALYRGAYKINDIYINKKDSASGMESPFFESHVIDLSVEWRSLFHGRLVGELKFLLPKLFFTKEKVEPAMVQKDTSDFRHLLKQFMPLKVNRFEVDRGEIHYVDSTSKPIVNIKMDEAHILATNLGNVVDTSKNNLPSTIVANANIYGGTLDFNMQLDPLAERTRFDMNAEIKHTHLPDLNNFFKAYAKADVNRGDFGMYTELAAADGKFIGYVKPIIIDLDVLGPEDRHDSFFHKLWEGFVGTTASVLSNWKKEQFATKIPLKGSLSNPKANIWVTVFEVLRNAFISALLPSLDYDINIASVNEAMPEKKNIFQKVFSGKKDGKMNADDEKKNKQKSSGNK
jgi:hypothetical protein